MHHRLVSHAHAGAPGAVDQGLFANLHAYVQINPALAPIAERLQLKRLVPMAVDQAIVEIITPVVERSVTIACMTAQELIVKVNRQLASITCQVAQITLLVFCGCPSYQCKLRLVSHRHASVV